MYIYGRECTLTLVQKTEQKQHLTAIPYSQETIREEKEETTLDPLVGYMMPLVNVPCGNDKLKVLGCAVTRVCGTSLKPIAGLLLNGFKTPFTLYLNRIVEKRIYSNLLLTDWEIRADRDDAIYVRLDMEGQEAADWEFETENVPWIQNETLCFYDGDLTFDETPSFNVYRFSLTRIYGDAITTILQIHYPLKDADCLNNIRHFNKVMLTLGDTLRFTLGESILLSFQANTDNAEEILVVRRFRIDGDCPIEIRNDKGEWVTPA